MYNIIIIWWWASGLFCASQLQKNNNKLILEKTGKLWTKVLLSWGGRCNFSNANIHPTEDYFWKEKRILPSLFHRFNSEDFLSFLRENWLEFIEENNGRLVLKNGKSQDLNNILIQKAIENNTEIKTNEIIISITKQENSFIISTETNQFETQKLIIATGWISFPQLWASNFWLEIAQQFGLEITGPLPGLCGIETNENMAPLTGNATTATIQLLDKNKLIYQETWNILFTHRWISWPIVFNTANALSEYYTKEQIWSTIQNQIKILLSIDPTTTIKKIATYFHLNTSSTIPLTIKKLRPWEEAKVMVGGIHMKEIKSTMESKKVPWLYFIGEILDITGKTGWYNLQRCRTSAYNCAKNIT